MIPHVIHYCWLSGDEIPDNLKRCMDSWGKIIPDYEFVKWDFNKFDIERSAWVKEAFANKKYAFACDYIRLYAVYNYGGIYLDMDMEVRKRFDGLLNQQYMLAYEREVGAGIEAGCFGAEAHSDYIGRCLNYYKDRHFVKEDGSFDQLPLPQIMQAELDRKGIDEGIKSCDYFTAKSFETGIITATQNTYTIHHFAGSWLTEAERKPMEVYRYWVARLGGKRGYIIGWLCKLPYSIKIRIKKLGLGGTIKFIGKKICRKE